MIGAEQAAPAVRTGGGGGSGVCGKDRMKLWVWPAVVGFLCGALLMNFASVGRSQSASINLYRNPAMWSLGTDSGTPHEHAVNEVVGLPAAIRATLRAPVDNEAALAEPEKPAEAMPVTPSPPAASKIPEAAETPEYLKDTAIISMATGDVSGRQALAMFQSLRDVGTQIPNVIVLLVRGGLGSAECNNKTWKLERGRQFISCHFPDVIPGEILSEQYLNGLMRLGVQLMMVDPIPRTKYTDVIVGGAQTFWGMAFNKLLVFNMTQFRKVIWIDSDSFVVKNIDHLMLKPTFTAAMVPACCHGLGPAYTGGGLWVLEPSHNLMAKLMDFISHPVPGSEDEGWRWGDMMVVNHFFGKPPNRFSSTYKEPYWPAVADERHGYAPGLRLLPFFKNMSDEDFKARMEYGLTSIEPRKPHHEGFIESTWDGVTPVWRALDIRYDQCVGNCVPSCMPERDFPDIMFSVHFSCMNSISKPGMHDSEKAFLDDVYMYAEGCIRYWIMLWYDAYVRAYGGRLPAPLYVGPPIPPKHNTTHDEWAKENRRIRRLNNPNGGWMYR